MRFPIAVIATTGLLFAGLTFAQDNNPPTDDSLDPPSASTPSEVSREFNSNLLPPIASSDAPLRDADPFGGPSMAPQRMRGRRSSGSGFGLGGRQRDQHVDPLAQKLFDAQKATDTLALQLKQVPAEKRVAAANQLSGALQKLFDVRTEMRERQIADLEKRIQALRTQLQERVEKKDVIIQLRQQTLVNDASGLTF